MSSEPQVGPAMWGGRRFAEQPQPAPDPNAPTPPRWTMEQLRDLAVAGGLTLAVPLVGVGAAIQWGLGLGMFAGGVAMFLVAGLLGWGE